MKISNFKLLLSFWALLMCSCTIHFDRPYANTVNEFPHEYWGKYLLIEKNDSSQDTVVMIISRDSVNYKNSVFLKGGKIDSTIKLAKGKKYYYLCQSQIDNNKEIWDIYPLKLSKNKLRVYIVDAEYYKKYFKKHFEKIEGIENLYKMDEKEFDKFCSSKLKKKNSIKFIKVE